MILWLPIAADASATSLELQLALKCEKIPLSYTNQTTDTLDMKSGQATKSTGQSVSQSAPQSLPQLVDLAIHSTRWESRTSGRSLIVAGNPANRRTLLCLGGIFSIAADLREEKVDDEIQHVP